MDDLEEMAKVADNSFNAATYSTGGFIAKLKELDQTIKDNKLDELENNGKIKEVYDERIKKIEEERDARLEAIDSVKAYLKEKGVEESDPEYEAILQDELDVYSVFNKEKEILDKDYANKRFEINKEVSDSIDSLNDSVTISLKDKLNKDIDELKKEKDELVNDLLNAIGVKDTAMTDEAIAAAQTRLKDGLGLVELPTKESGLSDKEVELAQLTNLYIAYFSNLEKLYSDYDKAEQDRIKVQTDATRQLKLNSDETSLEDKRNYELAILKEQEDSLLALADSKQEEQAIEERYAEEKAAINKKYDDEEAKALEEEKRALKEKETTLRDLTESVNLFEGSSPFDPLIDGAEEYKQKLEELKEKKEELEKIDPELFEKLAKSLNSENIKRIINDTLTVVSDYTSQLSGLVSTYLAQQVEIEEQLLDEYQDKKDNIEKEAKDSGRDLTKSEKDELARRSALLDEQIEKQTKKVKEEKEKQFKINQAFSIAEATISGVQATLSAFESGLTTGGIVLGTTLATIAGAFAAAQVALIASQPMPSYDKGAYNLPQDQIAQVHKGEMIIPKPFAEEIRSNGGISGGSSDILINVYGATDDVSVEESENGNSKQMDIYLTNRVKQMVARGELDTSMQSRYQISRNGRRN